jgi:hypothetical protein
MPKEIQMRIMKLNKILIISVITLFVVTSGQMAFGYGGPPVQSGTNNYTVDIYADNESYMLGDTITFTGTVNKYDDGRNLRITIFDSTDRYLITQKTLVETDGTFSHSIELNKKFSEGKFIVKAQYGSTNTTVKIMSFVISSNNDTTLSQDNEIPSWLKTTVGYWADGVSSDGEFVNAIKFLIEDGIIQIPQTPQGTGNTDQIPSWLKTTVGYWADGVSSDGEFVNAIKFLIENGLMTISN